MKGRQVWAKGCSWYCWLFEEPDDKDDNSSLEPSPYSRNINQELLVVDMVKSKKKIIKGEKENKDQGISDGFATVKKGYLR